MPHERERTPCVGPDRVVVSTDRLVIESAVGPCFLLVVILTPDVIFRHDRQLAEDDDPPGFHEWLWRRLTDRR